MNGNRIVFYGENPENKRIRKVVGNEMSGKHELALEIVLENAVGVSKALVNS
jgi:hypothetical protein